MIDFVSTRPGTSNESKACARLLTAVIALAIRDACTPLDSNEKKSERNMNAEARDAVRFLFDDGGVFALYADLIGSSAEAIRYALLNKRDEDVQIASQRGFVDNDRRALYRRLRIYRQETALINSIPIQYVD